MEHSRKQKLLVIIALIVGIASLSVGFAAFSTALNISSSVSVTPSTDTFSVKFSNNIDRLVEGTIGAADYSTGITPYDAVIDNSGNPTVRGFGATFTEPNQFVEYGVYARNEGEYTAYLNNVNFIGKKVCTAEDGTSDSLVQAACDYIDITVRVGDTTYSETTSVSGHALASGQSELIYIYIEYRNGPSVDGPFSISFSDIAFVYSTIDDSTMKPEVVRLESGDLNTPGSIVSIGNEQFYVFGQEEGNVNLLSMYNLHVGNKLEEGNIIIPLENPSGIQSSFALARVSGASYPYIGTTAYSSDGTTAYAGSLVEGYVNNYSVYLQNLGVDIVEARLITDTEMRALGMTVAEEVYQGDYDWLYSSSYWTSTDAGTIAVWRMSGGTEPFYWTLPAEYGDVAGVRPVIIISESEF